MKKYSASITSALLIMCALLAAVQPETAGAQEVATGQDSTGVFTGRITIPVVKEERRTFRGRLYRNRLSNTAAPEKSDNRRSSGFSDVIISVHPAFPDSLRILPVNARIIQTDATFVPRVTAITRGSRIDFVNLDNFFHNVFSITPGERFNIGRKPTGVVNELRSSEARRVFTNILPVEVAHFVTYKSELGKSLQDFLPAIDGSLFEDMSSGLG